MVLAIEQSLDKALLVRSRFPEPYIKIFRINDVYRQWLE